MSLSQYQKKRDFRRTPEPKGKRQTSRNRHRFVIQKHAASHLHYDFRLELDGVLKSWAVPKGPSLDPKVKALAMQVEDHPLEYGSFEGIIPQGEYGGGTVMLWDHGTWEPEGDAQKAYNAGKLSFELHGEKLRGGWTLVRMRGRNRDKGRSWLLIKQDDDDARSIKKYNVLTEEPASVVSGREMQEIAEAAERVWQSNGSTTKKRGRSKRGSGARSAKAKKNSSDDSSGPAFSADMVAEAPQARAAKQPNVLKPALATLVDRIPRGDNWLHEVKFDGYRLMAFIRDGHARLITRRGQDWTDRFRDVARAVEQLPLTGGILDGEVVMLDERGISNFQRLQNTLKQHETGHLVYYVFDAPYLESYDLTETPLAARKELLSQLLLRERPDNDGTVRYSDHIRGQGDEVVEQACRDALEGIISKQADSIYASGRSKNWVKTKCLKRQEFVIGGYTKPSGSRVGFGALLLGYYDNDQLKYCGRVGTGFTTKSLRQMVAELRPLRTEAPPFADPLTGSERRGVTWVLPQLVAEVQFTEWTSDGRLRHPSFQGLREDKPPRQIGREHPKKISNSPQASTMKRKTGNSKSNDSETVAGVRITHPDRVLFPDQGLTKRDLAEFYVEIADWILPHIVKRPLTLVRCPRGEGGDCFYQKHVGESMPEAVHSVTIEEKSDEGEYVVIDDLAGLISLVQIGVLELHPWPALVDALERPDRLVFDFDPGEGVAWKDVVQGARDLRKRLDELELQSFLRTSGGKGLHVVIPLTRRNTWDELKSFAKAVADDLVRQQPDRYIATMSKAKRRGKIFVDYLRNQRGATAVASYSTRARPKAPVATPVRWEELSTRLRPDQYTVANLPQRLAKLDDDPWAGFFDVRQSITRAMRDAVAS